MNLTIHDINHDSKNRSNDSYTINDTNYTAWNCYSLWMLPQWWCPKSRTMQSVVVVVVDSDMACCKYSWQVWSQLLFYLASQTREEISQYNSELRNTTKGNRAISEHILGIMALVDALASFGHFVSVKEPLEIILNAVILLAQESTIEKHFKGGTKKVLQILVP
ncbi:hypothetical protein Lal_00024532 [Lupinus albus]|nr:hypothetical protein Lal_00024532 [Lupinus albus]